MLKDVAVARGGSDASKVDQVRRRSLGIYYTPHTAAQVLARWAIRQRADTVLEPSFGGCALLAAAVDRLRQLGSKHPATQLRGYDIDAGAFAYLNRLLGSEFSGRPQFLRGDFLRADPSNSEPAAAIIANPPFVSWHRMNSAQRNVVRQWRSRYAPQFPMTASLWAYFLAHASQFLKSGGRLAFVLPASSLTADYGRSVIDELARRFTKIHLFRLNEQLFIQAGAQERTVLLLAENRQSPEVAPGSVHDHSVPSLAELENAIDSLGAADRKESSRPGARSTSLDTLRAKGDLCDLGSFAQIDIGEVVGDTRFFVKTTSEWESLGIDSRSFLGLLTGMRQISGLHVSKLDVSSRYSAIPRLLSVSAKRGGIPRRVALYLKSYPLEARNKNVTFAKRTPWYAVSYETSVKAFIGSISNDAPRVVLNAAKISCANGLYKLSPLTGIRWNPLVAVAALSTVTQLSAEARARALGSGGLKLEPSDVRKLDLPASIWQIAKDRAIELIRRVDALLREGERAAAIRLADEGLLIAPRLITPRDLQNIRGQLAEIRCMRIPKKL